MAKNFADKTFVIAGATSGLGSDIAKRLSSLGANLVLTGRSGTKLQELAMSLDTKTEIVIWDTTEDTMEVVLSSALSNAKANLGISGFDGGVYCVGVAPILPLRGVSQKSAEEIFRINYMGAVIFTKLLASKALRHENGASLVLISSVSAHSGEKGLGLYGASKAALVASTRAFAKELASLKIRINCVSPGWIETEMSKQNSDTALGLESKMENTHPLGLGVPDYVTSAVTFLLSNEAKWITGTDMVVDGGFLA